MSFKIIGAILVVVACGGFGCRLAAAHRSDMAHLRDLIGTLDYMECELNYHLTPLPMLCRQAAAEHKKTLGNVFTLLAEELENQISPDAGHCMLTAIAKCSPFPTATDACLRELGKSLGRFDLDGQLAGLKAVRTTCRRKLEELNTNRDVRIRSYHALGLCTGAALAILLI
jgi:stage III sporulation protein AB